MKIKFDDIATGTRVTLTNEPWGADEDVMPKVEVSGVLVLADPSDPSDSHFVRVREDYDGVSGVNFRTEHVQEAEVLPSGRIVVVLKRP